MMRYFDAALFVLSAFIALYVMAAHSAPWLIIAVYWCVNAVKKLSEHAKDEVTE